MKLGTGHSDTLYKRSERFQNELQPFKACKYQSDLHRSMLHAHVNYMPLGWSQDNLKHTQEIASLTQSWQVSGSGRPHDLAGLILSQFFLFLLFLLLLLLHACIVTL